MGSEIENKKGWHDVIVDIATGIVTAWELAT